MNLNNALNRALEADRIRRESGKSPGTKLTVVLRNDAPLIHCGDSPSYRTVELTLTEEQERAIMLRKTGIDCGKTHYEAISKLILE